MRVAILCEFFYPDNMGGTGTIVSNLARELQDHFPDVEVSAITSANLYRSAGNSDPLKSHENWDGINIRRLRTPKTKQKSSLLRIAAGLIFTSAVTLRLLCSKKYDVLLVLTNPPMLPLASQLVQKLRGTPYIFLIHDLYADMSIALGLASASSPSVRASQKLQATFLHDAKRVVVLGRCMKEHLESTFELPSKKTAVVTNWGTLPEAKPKQESRFRKQHNLNGFVVLYAGNFGRFHNFDNILNVAARLRTSHTSIHFVFVGGGAKEDEIKARVERDGLSNVQVLPFVPHEELADMLAAADVSLITLEHGTEGLAVPCKFYNVLASGRASIAIMDEKAETARVITEEACGVCIPQNDPLVLESVLLSLATDPDRVEQMGHNARQAYKRRYTLSLIAKQFYEILREAVS